MFLVKRLITKIDYIYYCKKAIRSVEHGICPIAEFTSPCLHCVHSNRIPYPLFC